MLHSGLVNSALLWLARSRSPFLLCELELSLKLFIDSSHYGRFVTIQVCNKRSIPLFFVSYRPRSIGKQPDFGLSGIKIIRFSKTRDVNYRSETNFIQYCYSITSSFIERLLISDTNEEKRNKPIRNDGLPTGPQASGLWFARADLGRQG